MKLNADCVRDIMLYLEDNLLISVNGFTPLSRLAFFNHFHGKYSNEDVLYSLIQLHESEYIVTDFHFDMNAGERNVTLTYVFYIKPKGHEFISKTRDEDTWKKKMSPIFKKFGSVSLALLETIAQGVTQGVLSNSFPNSLA